MPSKKVVGHESAGQEGWTRHLMERTGWWFNLNKTLSILSHHPVCGVKVAGATFSYYRSHPSWPGGAIRPNAFQRLANNVC